MTSPSLRFWAIFLFLFALCISLSLRSYWHFGWLGEALTFGMTYLIFLAVMVLASFRFLRFSAILLFVWSLFLSFWILPAEWRFAQLKAQSSPLIAWLEDQKEQKGEYPASLIHYQGKTEGMVYTPENRNSSFLLYYSTASKRVCHWFRPKHGNWQYYDD